MYADPFRIERQRQADLGADVASFGDEAPPASVAFLAQTTTLASYPTTAGAYYAVCPVAVDGTEAEGSTPTFEADLTRTFLALNLGSAIPPAGTVVIVALAGGKWVFQYGS